MLTAESVYESSVATVPKSEQLKLAALILDNLTATAAAGLDYSDSWSDDDLCDVAPYAADYSAVLYGEEVDGA